MRWFRMYDEVLNDPKVQQLPAELFRIWVNLLCVSSANSERGSCGTIEEISFHLRLTKPKTERAIDALILAGLLEKRGNIIVPHNWDRRQFASDDVARRVAKHRNAVTGNAACNVTETLPVTPPETDTDTEEIPDGISVGGAVAPTTPKPLPKPRAQRLPNDWAPGDRERDWAAKAGYDDLLIHSETEKFRDHFTASGKPAVDWAAAWRNWIRRSAEFTPKVTPLYRNGKAPVDGNLTNEQLEVLARGGSL